jgi:hypothetical protein
MQKKSMEQSRKKTSSSLDSGLYTRKGGSFFKKLPLHHVLSELQSGFPIKIARKILIQILSSERST